MRDSTEAVRLPATYVGAMPFAHRPRRVMVGFDGSPGAFDAIALVRAIAADAVAVLVYVPPHEDPVAKHYRPLELDGRTVPADFFATATAALAGTKVEARAYVGASPAHVLCDLTERDGFDLVVLGSPHRSGIGRALIGSVAEALLHGSRIPVVLAPRGYAREDHAAPRRIAVAYDATAESDVALRHGEAMALATGAALKVLTVVAPPGGGPDALVESRSSRVEPYAFVEEAAALVDGRIEVSTRKLIGPIADILAEACEEDRIDLLIVGSRDYGPLRRALLGSVSNRLIHIASCPVLLVPRP